MEKLHREGWKGFVELCSDAGDDQTLAAIFELMLTAEEREDLSMRYLIVRELLQQKKTQRDMARDLNVSIAKITRGSNEMKRMKESLIQYLKNKLVK
jgi:TrpR family trp operon transcriptional repressor